MEVEGPTSWIPRLREFARSNAGRLALVETDGPPGPGAGDAACRFLRGIAYHPEENRIEILLGGPRDVDAGVALTVPDPVEIELQTGRDGRDASLWIARRGGRTLLRLY